MVSKLKKYIRQFQSNSAERCSRAVIPNPINPVRQSGKTAIKSNHAHRIPFFKKNIFIFKQEIRMILFQKSL